MPEIPVTIKDIYFEIIDVDTQKSRKLGFGYYKDADLVVMVLQGDKKAFTKLQEKTGDNYTVSYEEPEIKLKRRLEGEVKGKQAYDLIFPVIEKVVSELGIPVPVEIDANVVRGGASGHRGGSMAELVIRPFAGSAISGLREYGVALLRPLLGMPGGNGQNESCITINSEPNLTVEAAEVRKIDMFREISLKIKGAESAIKFDVSEARARH